MIRKKRGSQINFSYISLEERVPQTHPLQRLRELLDRIPDLRRLLDLMGPKPA